MNEEREKNAQTAAHCTHIDLLPLPIKEWEKIQNVERIISNAIHSLTHIRTSHTWIDKYTRMLAATHTHRHTSTWVEITIKLKRIQYTTSESKIAEKKFNYNFFCFSSFSLLLTWRGFPFLRVSLSLSLPRWVRACMQSHHHRWTWRWRMKSDRRKLMNVKHKIRIMHEDVQRQHQLRHQHTHTQYAAVRQPNHPTDPNEINEEKIQKENTSSLISMDGRPEQANRYVSTCVVCCVFGCVAWRIYTAATAMHTIISTPLDYISGKWKSLESQFDWIQWCRWHFYVLVYRRRAHTHTHADTR